MAYRRLILHENEEILEKGHLYLFNSQVTTPKLYRQSAESPKFGFIAHLREQPKHVL